MPIVGIENSPKSITSVIEAPQTPAQEFIAIVYRSLAFLHNYQLKNPEHFRRVFRGWSINKSPHGEFGATFHNKAGTSISISVNPNRGEEQAVVERSEEGSRRGAKAFIRGHEEHIHTFPQLEKNNSTRDEVENAAQVLLENLPGLVVKP